MDLSRCCPDVGLYNALVELIIIDEYEEERRATCARNILITIFNIEMIQFTLSPPAKAKIGSLILKALPSFELCFDQECYGFPVTNFVDACCVRSGWQFLVDNCRNFFVSADYENVYQKLRNYSHVFDLESVDVKLYLYDIEIPEPSSDIAYVSSALVLNNVAKDHSWWFPSSARRRMFSQ
jgi:hypothetical protein